jgi:Sulfotransferase domain
LPVRNAESWYKSVYDTIFTRLTTPLPAQAPGSRHRHRAMTRKIVLDEFFGGRFEDKEHAIAAYNRRNEEVRRTIEPSRLLVYDMKDGWEPLCRFLGVPIPEEPFPRLNDTASFLAWVAEDDEELSQ